MVINKGEKTMSIRVILKPSEFSTIKYWDKCINDNGKSMRRLMPQFEWLAPFMDHPSFFPKTYSRIWGRWASPVINDDLDIIDPIIERLEKYIQDGEGRVIYDNLLLIKTRYGVIPLTASEAPEILRRLKRLKAFADDWDGSGGRISSDTDSQILKGSAYAHPFRRFFIRFY